MPHMGMPEPVKAAWDTLGGPDPVEHEDELGGPDESAGDVLGDPDPGDGEDEFGGPDISDRDILGGQDHQGEDLLRPPAGD